MGMSKNEFNEIKSKYLKEDIYIPFNKNLKGLKKNIKYKRSINFDYNIFKFTYIYFENNIELRKKVVINSSNKIYNDIHRAPYSIDRIISNRIKWIMGRI